jgi:hypothetical protein
VLFSAVLACFWLPMCMWCACWINPSPCIQCYHMPWYLCFGCCVIPWPVIWMKDWGWFIIILLSWVAL